MDGLAVGHYVQDQTISSRLPAKGQSIVWSNLRCAFRVVSSLLASSLLFIFDLIWSGLVWSGQVESGLVLAGLG